MLSESDAEEMSTRATRYMMGFLVANFSTFSDLKEFVPDETPLHPVSSSDPIQQMHRSFLHVAYSYVDLRRAIRWENGPHIVRHWKWWLPRFLAAGCSNYASEAVHLIANLSAIFPKHIALF